MIQNSIPPFGHATKMHMHKEREKEWTRESHLIAKSWFSPLDVKVLKEL